MIKRTPLDISEDDHSRSRYMWHLIHNSDSTVSLDIKVTIPRILIQYWNDVKTIPTDVRKCIDSWLPLDEQGFERFLFDDEDAWHFIANNYDRHYIDAFKRCQHPAMRSDYFRLCYIFKKGGFYVDADDVYKDVNIEALFHDDKLKVQPLCYDISTDLMVDVDKFTANYEYSPTQIFYVNNDPIIAPPNHPLICMALERSTRILLASEKNIRDIQSTTGPGNLTASLVRHAIESKNVGKDLDFTLLSNWDDVSVPQWPLDYRKDKRNWRIWDGSDM